MQYKRINIGLLILIFGFIFNTGFAQQKKEKSSKNKIKKYSEVITDKLSSDEGLFTVHQSDEEDKFYYEIPTNLLGRDMLLVSRISKIAAELGGGYLNAGSKTNEQLVRWSRIRNKIVLRSVSYTSVANDSLPISISVSNNNYQPIIHAFDIVAFNENSASIVIEVSKLFMTDIPSIGGLSQRLRKQYAVKKLDTKRSFINRISSYPSNIEVRHDMTFSASKPPSNAKSSTISLEMSQSMYLLPEKPMTARLHDKRVGWFTVSNIDYGSEALKSDKKTYIKRWKLEPKNPEAYARGELTEPKEPIVYYLDPATPKKWRKYFRQGVEDWQVAFEAAGFKNAIIAKDAPTKEEDPDWSPEDSRYSTIRYVASTTRNAIGPSVVDPRSGQIIESDIIWYHNHLRSYRNRYLIETGAANKDARSLNTPEDKIGEMMRRVISHEVGHTLGLPHNMKASYAYPTDSLRSATFTQKWGLATTIMDYTRYNYVAQPGDKGVRWVRMLGPYDSYSINWGYRYIDGIDKPEQEKSELSKWITDKAEDPKYLFGGRNSYDPSSQTECVGDDSVLASTYGLSNLKIVAKNLNKWTATKGEGYGDLKELYGELINVWSMYVGHVITNIGGVYELIKTTDQQGYSYTNMPKDKQIESMSFLNENAFTTPNWLLNKDIIKNISHSGSVEKIGKMQNRLLSRLLRKDRLDRMVNNEAQNGNQAYTMVSMFESLRESIWSELKDKKHIDTYRRNLQRSHVEALIKLINKDSDNRSDISSVSRHELYAISNSIKNSLSKYNNGIVKYHLEETREIIKNILETK
ncbi:MAG: zinc-dependent metalloprotease [Flavobacteriaceae bacterium]|nr:zinc-dependent metalloprotease [Flavobacteriaceae bacterium]